MLTDGINTILKEKEQVGQSTGQSKLFFRAGYQDCSQHPMVLSLHTP